METNVLKMIISEILKLNYELQIVGGAIRLLVIRKAFSQTPYLQISHYYTKNEYLMTKQFIRSKRIVPPDNSLKAQFK